MHITVIGAGVVGLTTALTLQEHGHAVRVVAAATGEATTSAVAGACWFPYRVGPPDKVAAWAAASRDWLSTTAASDPDAGVTPIVGYEITSDTAAAGLPKPWWAAHIDVDRAPAPVAGAPIAWRYQSLGIEPARHLPWLTRQLRQPIEPRSVTDLAAEPGDLVINCTGLAARDIAADPAVGGLFGQVVIVEPGGVDRSITVTDERDPAASFYVIPRSGELVLGGCSLPWPPGALPAVDPAITERILGQARALGLPIGQVLRIRVGLRPYRPSVRLERTGRIIHNYGHGGAGYTLSRGCAEAVAELV